MAIEVYKAIPVEAIRKANVERKRIKPNSYFNKLLLGKDRDGFYNTIPSEMFREGNCWFTGTGFAYEKKGKVFGDKIEKEFTNPDAGKKQTLIYYVRKEDVGTKNIMHLFEHQFRGDESTIQLINARNGKQIFYKDRKKKCDGKGDHATAGLIKLIARSDNAPL